MPGPKGELFYATIKNDCTVGMNRYRDAPGGLKTLRKLKISALTRPSRDGYPFREGGKPIMARLHKRRLVLYLRLGRWVIVVWRGGGVV